MSLTYSEEKRAVWVWNKRRDIKEVAEALGRSEADVMAYLETRGPSGYPGRIRVYTPSSAHERKVTLPPLPKGWG